MTTRDYSYTPRTSPVGRKHGVYTITRLLYRLSYGNRRYMVKCSVCSTVREISEPNLYTPSAKTGCPSCPNRFCRIEGCTSLVYSNGSSYCRLHKRTAALGRRCLSCKRSDSETRWSDVSTRCAGCDRLGSRNGWCPCGSALWKKNSPDAVPVCRAGCVLAVPQVPVLQGEASEPGAGFVPELLVDWDLPASTQLRGSPHDPC